MSTVLARVVVLGMVLFAALSAQSEAKGVTQSGDPTIVYVGAVSPNVLALTVRVGKVIRGTQMPYVPEPADKISRSGDGSKTQSWLTRKGSTVGAIVGLKSDILRTVDRLVGQTFSTKWADSADSYTLSSKSDTDYKLETKPLKVFRKSKPVDFAQTGPWNFKWSVDHTMYLQLSKPLKPGNDYTVSFGGDKLAAYTFTWTPSEVRSEAVHVTQVGFRPDDTAKVAFLSCWRGSGGGQTYTSGTPFHVLDDATGQAVLSGKIVLSRGQSEPEDAYKRNYNLTDIYKMDISGLKRPGTYRVYVEGIGCSYPFKVSTTTWRDAFTIAAKGFYHQRSGIALGPPYTDFERPRSFHPDDGVVVYQSTCTLMDSGNGLNALGTDKDNFGNLVKGATTEVVPNAWGGYFDAGDWDRRIQHLDATRLLLELALMEPNLAQDTSLNIPESGNGIPDIINEALWNIDLFRRLQTPDGGIRGGIESVEHPKFGEGSWQNTLTNYAYAPDCWSSFVYAGVAARVAVVLKSIRPDLARTYTDSSLKAMLWGEKDYAKVSAARVLPHAVRDARNLAAIELYRLTGDKRWHTVFIETTVFTSPAELSVWTDHDQADAAFLYASLNLPGLDTNVKANCTAALETSADASWELCQNTGFRWTKINPYNPVAWGALGPPQVVNLVRAHYLTGKGNYLRAVILASQYGAGANPMNMTLTTGVGSVSPKNLLWLDALQVNRPAPPGLTVFGPMDMEQAGDQFAISIMGSALYPESAKWPTTEAYFDIFWFPEVCEFTVNSTLGPNTYAWGYLAGRK